MNIIFLNGTSSAGKSSIAKALQKILDEPCLHLGNDQFLTHRFSNAVADDSVSNRGVEAR